jgi:hypothetical protein
VTTPALNECERTALREAILTTCGEEAQAISEILAAPAVAGFVERVGAKLVREMVYALATAGLLFRNGRTRAFYRTTRLGKEAMQRPLIAAMAGEGA